MRDVTTKEAPLFTYGLAAAAVILFVAQFAEKDLSAIWEFPWRLGSGELYRLVTSTMLHGSVIHILFNLALFVPLSTAIERWLGPWLSVALFIYLAAGSSAVQSLGSGAFAIGLSGVVYGQFGFLWSLRRRCPNATAIISPSLVQTMLGWLVICFLLNQFGGHIANTAHIAGLFFGWILGQGLVHFRGKRIAVMAAAAAAWVLSLVLLLQPVWTRTLAHVPYLRSTYTPDFHSFFAVSYEVNDAFKAAPPALQEQEIENKRQEFEQEVGTKRPEGLF